MALAPDQQRSGFRDAGRQRIGRDLVFHSDRADDGSRDDGDAGARCHARHDGVVGTELHHAVRNHVGSSQPVLQAPAVCTSARECDDRPAADIGRRLDLREARRRDQDQLLVECVLRIEISRGERFGNECRLDLVVEDLRYQGSGRARHELETNLRVRQVIAR
jgi:hypothetical protein